MNDKTGGTLLKPRQMSCHHIRFHFLTSELNES